MITARVLGGTGYLGSRVVSALSRVPSLRVQSASRRGDVRVDVTQPSTFSALEGTDILVDVSDATSIAPDELIAWCLARGTTVIETTSDSRCVERLHKRFGDTSGRLVLGGGIFTGISNLLARDVSRSVGAARAVQLAISSSPFSGAGAGTIELMLEAMRIPVVSWRGGERVEGAKMTAGPAVDFGAAVRPTLLAPFAEAYMLRESTGAMDVEVLFSPRPAVLVSSFRLMPAWVGRSRAGRALMRWYFTVLRRWVLSRVASAVELYARASREDVRAERRVVAADGMMAGAWAIAAMVEQIGQSISSESWKGARFIDDVCALEPIVARANELAQSEQIRLS